MKQYKGLLPRAAMLFIILTLLCGVAYTGAVTGIAQILFPNKANGSIIEVNHKTYGCELLAQQYTSPKHMWGRLMNLDISTFTDKNGKQLMYAVPSNLSPTSKAFESIVANRVEALRKANPEMSGNPIPVDLVTCSGSGLDPHISVAAALYQIPRLAKNNNMTENDIRTLIDRCTNGRFLGIFGEKTVNVLKVNLMLEGIL